MGTPSKTILNQLRYLHAKFGAFVQRVTIFSLSHLTINQIYQNMAKHNLHVEFKHTDSLVEFSLPLVKRLTVL